MKSVSPAYKDMQSSHEIKPIRKVELFRRLADGSDWETAPIDVTGEVVRLDRLSWKLDTDDLNVFKASNIRFTVENIERRWDEGSSRFAGFLRYRSKVRIQLGLKPNGTEEIFPVFTGVIEDILEDSRQPTLQIAVESFDALLRTQSSEGAGIPVTNELLGVGDGVTADFFTSQFAVGIIKEIRVGGSVNKPGKDFSVSQLNDPDKPAKVTFLTSQPGSGQEVRADYIRWKTNQAIESVVQDLLALVPQVPVDNIEPVTFIDPTFEAEVKHTLETDFNQYELRQAKVVSEPAPPSGDGAVTLDGFDTQAKWQGGTASGIDFTRVPDSMIVDWPVRYEADVLPAAEPGWSESDLGTSSKQVSNGILSFSLGASDSWIYQNFNGFSPKRSLYWRFRWSPNIAQYEVSSFFSGTGLGVRALFINGFQVQIEGGSIQTISQDSLSFHNYSLELDQSANTWRFLVDGAVRATGTLGSIAGSVDGFRTKASGTMFIEIDYLRMTDDTASPVGTWEKIIDYGVHLGNVIGFGLINTLGSFFAELLDNAPDVSFIYAFSNDGISYDAEQAIANGGNLGSFTNVTPKRYLKFRIVIQGSGAPNFASVRRLYLPGLAASNVITPGTSPIFWDSWQASADPGTGTVRRFTGHTAPSASGFSYYQSIGPGDEITSDEFARAQGGTPDDLVMVTLLNATGLTPPLLRESVVNYSTNLVLVSVANVGTRNVLDVIQELGRIADFEIGVNGDGAFFFRNKDSASSSVLALDGSNVLEVRSFSPGWDRVFNRIQANFGSFSAQADSASESDPSPTSNQRFGVQTLSVGGGSLLFQTDVDLATGMSKRYFRRYKEPRQRITLLVPFMPELELGDRVDVDIDLPRRITGAFSGRILGIAHSLMDFKTELDVQEV